MTLSITNKQNKEIKKNSILDTLNRRTRLNKMKKDKISKTRRERRRLDDEKKKTMIRTTQKKTKKLNTG
jgi:hypothetical protein